MKNRYLLAVIAVLALTGCSGFQPVSALARAVTGPRPDVAYFRATPSRVESGTATMLRWEVKGAESVILDHGIGSVQGSGSLEIKPSGVTAYNLTAVNKGGTVVSSVIINVVPAVVKPASLPPTPPAPPVPAGTNNTQADVPDGLLPKLQANESYVFYQGAVMVGADNHYIVLRNNPTALNPAWADLKAFLQADQTDRQSYVNGKFTCGDFAEMLHNNAEAAGIRTAIVALELKPAGLAEGVINHSANAFETTDRGMVYIDVTSSSQGFFADKVVNLIVGNEYQPVAVFTLPGQAQTWTSMGRIEAIDVFQW